MEHLLRRILSHFILLNRLSFLFGYEVPMFEEAQRVFLHLRIHRAEGVQNRHQYEIARASKFGCRNTQ